MDKPFIPRLNLLVCLLCSYMCMYEHIFEIPVKKNYFIISIFLQHIAFVLFIIQQYTVRSCGKLIGNYTVS